VFAKRFSEEAFGIEPKALVLQSSANFFGGAARKTELRSTYRVQASQNELAEPYEYNKRG
jgi:hypothetical protein